MLSTIRSYFAREQVMEVETPSLCQTAGTDPNIDFFTVGLNFEGSEYNRPLYLQTSPEFSMKRLLAAGSGSIYQICKAYRNGESGRFHNPEFTILEWYRVGYNLDFLMNDIDDLLTQILRQYRPNQNSERLGYRQAFLRHCGFDPLDADLSVFRDFASGCDDANAWSLCGDNIRLWQEYLFSCRVQPQLGKRGLCFVYDYPENQCALARIRPGEPRIAERVEVFYQARANEKLNTSSIDKAFTNNIKRRSSPTATPEQSGRPDSSAARKYSSIKGRSLPISQRISKSRSNLFRCSSEQVNSQNPLASSIP